MKRLLFAIFVAFFGFMSAGAQIVEDLEYPRVHFGIRAGVTSSSLHLDYGDGYKSSSLTHPSGGLAFDLRVASIPLYLETGVYYTNRGYSLSGEKWRDRSMDGNYDGFGFRVPLVASYHLYLNDNMSIQPFIGGFFGYGDIDGKDSEDVDYGLRIGSGFNFGRWYANVGYDIGLMEQGTYVNSDGEEKSVKSGMLFFTVGFNFVGSY